MRERFPSAIPCALGDQVIMAASTAERDYTVRNFTVAKLLPDGHAAWRFSMGKPRGGDLSLSSAEVAVPDRAGDIIASGRIDLDGYGYILIKLAGSDGAEIWRHGAPQFALFLVDGAGDIVLADKVSPSIAKISGADGGELWRYQRSASSPGVHAMLLDDSGNPIVADGEMISKVASVTGVPIWAVPIDSDELLKGPPGELFGVSFPKVMALAIENGEVLGQFDLEHQPDEPCSRFAVDAQGDILATCGNHELVKWSGKSGAMLWRRFSPGSAFVIDPLGDVTVAGTRSLFHHDADCTEIDYLDYWGVLQKFWGKTGGDYPPSPSDRLRYLSDVIHTMGLAHGFENSLTAKLDQAMEVLEDDKAANDSIAVNLLSAFESEVKASDGKRIPTDDVKSLLGEVHQVIEVLSSP